MSKLGHTSHTSHMCQGHTRHVRCPGALVNHVVVVNTEGSGACHHQEQQVCKPCGLSFFTSNALMVLLHCCSLLQVLTPLPGPSALRYNLQTRSCTKSCACCLVLYQSPMPN
jgi:hypothetical protein